MMAPHYERARMLGVAIQTAVYELDEPIDRIEVIGGEVLAWAGSKCVAMRYGYENAYSEDGSAMPGSGSWQVTVEGQPADRSRSAARPRGLLRRVMGALRW